MVWEINYQSIAKFGLSIACGLLVAALVLNIAGLNTYSARIDSLEKERFEWLLSNSSATVGDILVKDLALNSIDTRKNETSMQMNIESKLVNRLMWWGLFLFLVSLFAWVFEEIMQKNKFKPYDPKTLRELLQRISNDPDILHWGFRGYFQKFNIPDHVRDKLFKSNYFIDVSKKGDKSEYTIGTAGASLVSAWENEALSKRLYYLTLFIILLTLVQIFFSI